MIVVLSAGVAIHAHNAFNFPRYQADEGVYTSAAWSVAHGALNPYTYNYGHPPLGWALIAAWSELTGGFFTFGTAINTGRVFMLVIFACSGLVVYLIARRLTGDAWTALLTAVLFSFSALSVYYQREVLLDNFAAFWALVACYLQVASESRLRYITGSAFAFGFSVLSKETMIVLLPVFLYGTWLCASRFQRRYLLIIFGYLSAALVSTFILLAALKNELFPTGTLLGGTNPHVSMITIFLQQAGRGSGEGSFGGQWGVWESLDRLLILGGALAIAGNLVFSWLQPRKGGLRVVALLPVLYLLFLARGGVTLSYYVIPLLPLLALNVALCVYGVISLAASVRWWRHLKLERWLVPPAMIAAIAVVLPFDLRMNRTNLTANETGPQVAALQWIGEHMPRSAKIIATNYNWLDMRSDDGLAAGQGAPFQHVEMYAVVATDPAIHTGVFHDDWNTVDYVIADSDMFADMQRMTMPLLRDALNHAVPVKKFQNKLFWVTIYEVQHRGSTDPSTPTLIQEVDGLSHRPATSAPGTISPQP